MMYFNIMNLKCAVLFTLAVVSSAFIPGGCNDGGSLCISHARENCTYCTCLARHCCYSTWYEYCTLLNFYNHVHVNMTIFIVYNYNLFSNTTSLLTLSMSMYHYCLPSVQNSRQRKHVVLYFIVFIFVTCFWVPGMYTP